MSEIQRYAVIETALCIGGNVHDGEVLMVRADEHGRELAALREDLDKLREGGCELAELMGQRNDLIEGSDQLHTELCETRSKLTAAEQRNAELVESLDECDGDRHRLRDKCQRLEAFAQLIARQEGEPYFAKLARAALKPTESGASE